MLQQHLEGILATGALFDSAAELMLKKLNKYYNLMDNKALLLSVVLDPRFKLQFFVERGWNENQIGSLKDE